MSSENARLFFEKMEKDAELKMLFAKRLVAHQIETREAFSDMIVELGKEAGFEFTAFDLSKNGAGGTGALSDSELNRVAGGGAPDMTNDELLRIQQNLSSLSNSVSMTSSIQKMMNELIKGVLGGLRIL